MWLEFIRYHEDLGWILKRADDSTEGLEKEFICPNMSSDKSLVLIAKDGAKIVGYAVAQIQDVPYSTTRQIGFIDHMFVSQECRHKGIGGKMNDEIIAWFRSKSVSLVELQTMTRNQVANSFWRKHGFLDLQNTLYRQI